MDLQSLKNLKKKNLLRKSYPHCGHWQACMQYFPSIINTGSQSGKYTVPTYH